MTPIRHHPGSSMLAEFAFGTLDSGSWYVVAAHVGRCAKCRAVVKAYEDAGGMLLEDVEPAQMSATSADSMLERVLAEQNRPQPSAPDSAAVGPGCVGAPGSSSGGGTAASANGPGLDLDSVLKTHKQGPWRWIGPGVSMRSIADPGTGASRVFLLKALPGTALPQHSHSGTELTLVLSGSFSHEAGRFGPGDFEEADNSVEHQPVVDGKVPCICLVAMVGQLRLSGILGRLLQPFVRL